MLNQLILIGLLAQSLTAKAFTNAPGLPTLGIFCKFSGDVQFGTAALHWKLYEEGSKSRFFVERSENGKEFKELAVVNSIDGINFHYKDSAPLPSAFYRIKAIGADTVFSDIMRLSTLSGLPQVKVWPTIFDVVINMEIKSTINEVFSIVLTNSKGETILHKDVMTEYGINNTSFDDTISFLYADEYSIMVTGLQYSFCKKLYKK